MFKFSLQTALDVRSRQEKMKMKDLAEKLAVERTIVNKIDQIKSNTKKAENELDTAKESRYMTINQMIFLTGFKNRMKVVLAESYEQLQAAQKEVEEKQLALIEASKARKTIEILKEKEEKRYLEKITRMEKKNMDEIAGNLFIQKQRSSAWKAKKES